MSKSIENYQIIKIIARDHLKIQYLLSYHKLLKKYYLIKKVDKPIQNNELSLKERKKQQFVYGCIQNQISLSLQIKCDKILKCLKTLNTKNCLYAIYEEHPQKNLSQFILNQTLKIEQKQKLIYGLIQLIKRMHSQNIIIGNLSPQNIFVDHEFKVFTSNLLLAKKIPNQNYQINSSFFDSNNLFLAPELVRKGILSKTADIYSLGRIIENIIGQNQNESENIHSFEDWKKIIDRMTSYLAQERPSLDQVQKFFISNKSEENSTNDGYDQIQKSDQRNQFRILRSFRSQDVLKSSTKNSQNKNIPEFSPRKLKGTQHGNQDFMKNLSKQKRNSLKHKNTIDTVQSQGADDLKQRKQVSQKQNSSRNSTQLAYSQNNQNSAELQFRQKYESIFILRNTVSFLLQMFSFVYEQNQTCQLGYLLIQEAESFSKKSIRMFIQIQKLKSISKQFQGFIQSSRKQAIRICEIKNHFEDSLHHDFYRDLDFNHQLKSFARSMLSIYSNKVSQQPTNLRDQNKFKDQNKVLQEEVKLFNTLLLLKRIEYGSYNEFFKAKIHHMDRKFWNEHYFEFEKTFGARYFAIQIKDIISKRSTSIQKPRLVSKSKK